MTQQVAAGSQESAAAAEELSAQAVLMKTYVEELLATVSGETDRDVKSSSPTLSVRQGQFLNPFGLRNVDDALTEPATIEAGEMNYVTSKAKYDKNGMNTLQ